MTNPSRPVQILLVEDSPGDVSLTREELRGARVANTLHVAEDAESVQALERLEGSWLQVVRFPVAATHGAPTERGLAR